tara:strand:+ start:167 stop:511 length:345 start_codon:yes stop_codon:yes gene_type:complete
MSINFKSNQKNFGDSIGLSERRMHEISNAFKVKITDPNAEGKYQTKSELLEEIVKEVEITTSAEYFMLGTIYGSWLAADYTKREKTQEDVSFSHNKVLNKEAFVEVMKRDGDDF